MALPLIPVAIAMGITAAWGAYKGGKAISDHSEAKDINDSASFTVQHSTEELDRSRDMCEQALEKLGRTKYDALTINIYNFIKVFEQIKNVELEQDQRLEELKIAEFSNVVLKKLEQDITFLNSSGIAVAGGAAVGAMTAFGAYSGTMALASAGTGTAISSLSGAAATNATLAWLGGGTLASGGFGVAGGALMLNAMWAGPALAIAGWYMGNQAEKKLNDAKSNQELALKFKEDASIAITLTDNISEIAVNSVNLLSQLRKYSRRTTKALEKVIQNVGTDYQQYDQTAKETVLKSLKLVQLLKAVIDTPILNEKGELLGDANTKIENIRAASLTIIGSST